MKTSGLTLMEVLVIAAIVLIIAAITMNELAQEQQRAAWPKYAASHHCTPVAHEDARTLDGFVGGRVSAVRISGRTTYRCDGGLQITRSDDGFPH